MLELKQITNQKIWEDFVLNSPQVNFLQSWYWGRFHQQMGNQVFYLGFYKQNKLVGIALLIKIKAKRGHYFECPGGPILNWQKSKQLITAFDLIKKLALKQKLSFIRIRPNIAIKQINSNAIKRLNLKKAPMHLHAETTLILNLDQSQEKILANMRKNTRYSVKKAQKLGVKVTRSTAFKDVKLLYDLQLETVKRKKFVPFSLEYLQNQFQVFNQQNLIQLFKAEYKGKLLAVSYVIFYGPEAVYHYSGSSNQMRQIPASYLLQWEIIKTAQKKGIKRYNFWGYTDNPKHRFYGPSLFKKGFGGQVVKFMPAHDIVLKPSYWLTYIFETLRCIKRGL